MNADTFLGAVLAFNLGIAVLLMVQLRRGWKHEARVLQREHQLVTAVPMLTTDAGTLIIIREMRDYLHAVAIDDAEPDEGRLESISHFLDVRLMASAIAQEHTE